MTYQELYHHGIMGQRWGVKNGPPYPLKNSVDYTLKKGTVLQNVSRNAESDLSRGYLYVSRGKQAGNYYKRSISLNYFDPNGIKDNKNTEASYANKLVLNKDLKFPSDTYVRDAATDIFYKNFDPEKHTSSRIFYSQMKKNYYKNGNPNSIYNCSKEQANSNFKRLFGQIRSNPDMQQKFFDKLKKDGYDGCFDYEDIFHERVGHNSFIVFNPEKSLSLKKTELIMDKKTINYVENTLASERDQNKINDILNNDTYIKRAATFVDSYATAPIIDYTDWSSDMLYDFGKTI